MAYRLLCTTLAEINGNYPTSSQGYLNVLKKFGFDGITIPGWHWNKCGVETCLDEFDWLNDLQHAEQVWPNVYLTQIINAEGALDLDDESGCLTQFRLQLSVALEAARNAQSPGIFFDMELYTEGLNTTVAWAATKLGITIEELQNKLETFGATISDWIIDAYPDAIVWAALAPLRPQDNVKTYYWISKGLLDRAQEQGANFTLVGGGEIGIGYCLINMIQVRYNCNAIIADTASWPNLKLGAPIVIWNSQAGTSGWVRSQIDTYGNAFTGPLTLYSYLIFLEETFDYVWCYNDDATGFLPFSPSGNPSCTDMLRHAFYRQQIATSSGYDLIAAKVQHDANFAEGRYIQHEELTA